MDLDLIIKMHEEGFQDIMNHLNWTQGQKEKFLNHFYLLFGKERKSEVEIPKNSEPINVEDEQEESDDDDIISALPEVDKEKDRETAETLLRLREKYYTCTFVDYVEPTKTKGKK